MMKFEAKLVAQGKCPCYVKVEASGMDECHIPQFASDRICIGVYGAAKVFYHWMSKLDGECSVVEGEGIRDPFSMTDSTVDGRAVRMLPDLAFEKKDGITGDVRVERFVMCRKGKTYRGEDLWEGRADVTLRFPLLKGEESVLMLTTWRERKSSFDYSDHLTVKGSADDIQWFMKNAVKVAGELKCVADESVLHECKFLYGAAWDASRGLEIEAEH